MNWGRLLGKPRSLLRGGLPGEDNPKAWRECIVFLTAISVGQTVRAGENFHFPPILLYHIISYLSIYEWLEISKKKY